MAVALLLAAACKKAVVPPADPVAKQAAKDARPYAARLMPATELAQFNWQEQVVLRLNDSTALVKILMREPAANQLSYLLAHQHDGVFTDLVRHTITYNKNQSGRQMPVSMTSRSYSTGKAASGLLPVHRANSEVSQGLRGGAGRRSLVAPGTSLPVITITGFYSDGSAGGTIRLSTPLDYYLINGMLYQQGGGGGGINNEGDLAYLDPLWVPDAGTPQVIDLIDNRVHNGIVYNINNYPYKDKGFPWFWMEDPNWRSPEGYLYSRMAQLYEELEQNPNALINCQELQALIAYGPMFQQISTFQAPGAVINRLGEVRQQAPNFIVDNFNLQSLQDASGSVVNCDFFPVRITQLPSGFTAESLLEYFRTHINEFISPSQNKSFQPYQHGSFNDAARFYSPYEASVGSLIHIDMSTTNTILPLPVDGSVVISDYQRKTEPSGKQSHHFTFSTLETPLDFEHPVAGNRRFGIYNNSSSPNEFTFYTMAVDRTWDWSSGLGNGATNGFEDADRLWRNIQQNFVEFVTRHGGTAGTFQPKDYIATPDWDLVKDFLLGNIDLANFKQQVGC